ncbi:hypothetical protein BSPWISOXPB_1722 [uncultured Gammaproteobacteria bacterium]|nr:hypothetical protein BSPWISOXPB_1722 [uncultured Gammaproteobacteria bacterium]
MFFEFGITAYQYLGMTKIARALNQLTKTFLDTMYGIRIRIRNTGIREYGNTKMIRIIQNLGMIL